MHKHAPDDMVQLATRIPKTLHRAILLQAVVQERSVMVIVAEALTEHLTRLREQAQRHQAGEDA
jgi:hypothetical protein